MKVIKAKQDGNKSELRSETFSGTVWADTIKPFDQGVQINNVFFSPGGRTYWHAHEHGQILHVTAGRGWICKEGEAPQSISAGDVVWIAANERHWHGASTSTYMIHMATSLGITDWQDEVAQTEYESAG